MHSTLKDMVTRLGEGKWSLIAQSLPGRIGKQCRERWINHLNPNIKVKCIYLFLVSYFAHIYVRLVLFSLLLCLTREHGTP